MIDLTPDFKDILTDLADAGVDFLLVGGYAVGFHGHTRATKDIDILVRPGGENAKNVFKALALFGAPLDTLDVAEADFADYKGVVQIGVPPNRIDILTTISGVTYEEASLGCPQFQLESRVIKVIGIEALLKNKRAAGRDQDLLDVKALENYK